VILNVKDEREAEAAFSRLKKVAGKKSFLGVTIYPMIRPLHEALVGLYRDPQFGPVIAFGLGGIFTEILHEVSLRLAPLDKEEALSMILDTRFSPLLTGVRGQKPCDLESLAGLLEKVSLFPFSFPEITEMDLNPVFLLEKGVLIGDVRIIKDKERKDEPD
jgi:acyl-CoA synthetase (NDP forming)